MPRTLFTRAFCLIGQNGKYGKYASMVPIVRFHLGDGADQLAKGWDSADTANAPHEWIEITTPRAGDEKQPRLQARLV